MTALSTLEMVEDSALSLVFASTNISFAAVGQFLDEDKYDTTTPIKLSDLYEDAFD